MAVWAANGDLAKRVEWLASRVPGKRWRVRRMCPLYPPSQQEGEPPIVPVLYWHAPEDSGPRDLFDGIFDGVNYQLKRGRISEVRRRVYEVLRSCQVEMLLIDEAHRIRPKTFW